MSNYKTYKDHLQRFNKVMYGKLKKNAHKGFWVPLAPSYLFARLAQETKELQKAYKNHDKEGIVKEAADVANFAMMIADNFGRYEDE